MSYDYIKRTYQVMPRVGDRVRHTETDKLGTIAREKPSAGHYVQVRFDGQKHSLPCHPTALEYLGRAVA
jgi:hypothetical protein